MKSSQLRWVQYIKCGENFPIWSIAPGCVEWKLSVYLGYYTLEEILTDRKLVSGNGGFYVEKETDFWWNVRVLRKYLNI